MVTLARLAAGNRRGGIMAKRVPRPANPVRARCELDASELLAIEDAAHLCRLSVAAFIRVALIESAAHPERLDEWKAIAARIAEEGSDRPGPGRPKKAGGEDGAKPRKKK